MNTLSIKALRKQAGRTQSDMAELCGVSTNTYRAWENNPDAMPHGLWMEVIFHLEMAAQIRRKVTKMAEHLGEVGVRVDWDPKDDKFSVPVPEGLSETFKPSKPVTKEQEIAWLTDGVEPYEGYADEYEEWDKRWEEVNRRQLAADGAPAYESDTVQVDPEFDPETGEPVVYDEVHVVVDPETGEASMHGDAAEINEEVEGD